MLLGMDSHHHSPVNSRPCYFDTTEQLEIWTAKELHPDDGVRSPACCSVTSAVQKTVSVVDDLAQHPLNATQMDTRPGLAPGKS